MPCLAHDCSCAGVLYVCIMTALVIRLEVSDAGALHDHPPQVSVMFENGERAKGSLEAVLSVVGAHTVDIHVPVTEFVQLSAQAHRLARVCVFENAARTKAWISPLVEIRCVPSQWLMVQRDPALETAGLWFSHEVHSALVHYYPLAHWAVAMVHECSASTAFLKFPDARTAVAVWRHINDWGRSHEQWPNTVGVVCSLIAAPTESRDSFPGFGGSAFLDPGRVTFGTIYCPRACSGGFDVEDACSDMFGGVLSEERADFLLAA